MDHHSRVTDSSSNTTEITRHVVEEYFSFMAQGKAPEEISALFSDDVDWDIPGDVGNVPWIGNRRSRNDIAEFIRSLRGLTLPISFEVQQIIADKEVAVAVGVLETRVVSTQKIIRTEFAFQFTVTSGLITKFRLFEDSFAVAQAVIAGGQVVGQTPGTQSLTISVREDQNGTARIEAIRTYFKKVDAGDPSVLNLFTEDTQLFFPKFGVAHGKQALVTFAERMGSNLASIGHDIDGLKFYVSGATIIVEGREWGTTRDERTWPDGIVSQGLFCSVFEFDGLLIRRMHIYADPDFTSSDNDRIRYLRGE